MPRLDARVVAGVLALVAALVAGPIPAADASPASVPARARVAGIKERPEPGPVHPGFKGMAYPVPSGTQTTVPGEVRVTLKNEDGKVVGTDTVPSGRPLRLEALDAPSDQVAIPWKRGTTAYVPRRSFWAMPAFVGLADMKVTVDGRTTSVATSGLYYDRSPARAFDDPTTPIYDGTLPITRQLLACQRDTWGMGQQTWAADLIEVGIHAKNPTQLAQGVKAVDWGVSVPVNDAGVHELHRDCDGRTIPDFGYTHHTTQWLESLGRTVYLLAGSEYAGQYRATIDRYIDRIELLATRLTQPANWKYWNSKVTNGYGNEYTHRLYMMAAALGLASTLTDDKGDAERWARLAATVGRHGMANQRPNGVNPERGGFDVGYQMFGTWLAELYLASLPPGTALKRDLERTIGRAVEWMAGRIDDTTGQIEIRGSSRTCAEALWSSGSKAPWLDVSETVRTLLLWGLVASDRDAVDLAVLVDRGQAAGNSCPTGDYRPPVEQYAKPAGRSAASP